jgi:glycosyltransferase involved in cell wall biosynthesis
MEATFPLVTVGVVVLNREWIIGKMLNSLLYQTYPHGRIFVVIVDGGSKDRTVEVARKMLEKSDFMGYDIVVKECSIPEGRNICLEKAQGDMLFSWDSDVVMQPDALQNMVTIMMQKKVDIVDADCIGIFVNSIDEVDEKINEVLRSCTESCKDYVVEAPSTGMGHTLISRNVFSGIHFDPDLTTCEDLDFSVRAREKGFKIVLAKSVMAIDVNMRKKGYSDIDINMPLKRSLRGLRKKAKFSVLAYNTKLDFKDAVVYFLKYRRYLFYLGYVPTLILTIYGLVANNYLFLTLPIYLCLFTLWQIKRRGSRQGIQAVFRSIVVGVPFSLWLVYYFAKYALKR